MRKIPISLTEASSRAPVYMAAAVKGGALDTSPGHIFELFTSEEDAMAYLDRIVRTNPDLTGYCYRLGLAFKMVSAGRVSYFRQGAYREESVMPSRVTAKKAIKYAEARTASKRYQRSIARR